MKSKKSNNLQNTSKKINTNNTENTPKKISKDAAKSIIAENRMDRSKKLLQKAYEKLPSDFNWKYYLEINPEIKAKIGYTEEAAIYHYLKYGKEENRQYSKKTIYLKPRNGLGNRIMNINDMYAFAKDHHANLKICWIATEGFSDEKFSELFDLSHIPDDITFISLETYQQETNNLLKLHEYIHQNPDSFQYRFDINSDELLDRMKHESFCYDSWSSIAWVFEKQLWKQMYTRNDFIRCLEPNALLKQTIDKISKSFSSDIIGVHIRRGDASRSSFHDQYLRSSNDAFMLEMNKHVGIKSGVQQFFLATDCKKTQQYMLDNKILESSVIYYDTKQFVSDDITMHCNKPNQKDAVIDLFLLSKTSTILGNHWSTFDDLAARIGNINCRKVNPLIENSSLNQDQISVLVGVKNRQKALHISLNSWLQHNLIKQIVIVDWSSDIDLSYLESWDNRIKVVRVEGKLKYSVAEALNTGIPYLHNQKILKLDVDYIINPYFDLAEITNINENEFLAGSWSQYREDNNLGFIENLHGLVCVYKKHLVNIDGYNENIKEYGWEDSDLYERLELNGLQPKNLNFAHNHVPMFHIPHKNQHRTQHYNDQDVYRTLLKNRAIARSDIAENTKLTKLTKQYTGLQKIIRVCDYLQSDDLKHFDNQLESIGLLLTGNELMDGSYEMFIDRLTSTTINNYITQQLHFNIFCKKSDAETINVRKLKKIFGKVNIQSIEVPDALDYYYKYDPSTVHYGTYGKKSGPNFAFFEAIKESRIYNTTLFLECDCYFGKDWLSRIYNYTNNYGGFLISGALYLSNYDTHKNINDIINSHINGGICLYATGGAFFQKFMEFCYDKMPEIIRTNHMGDVAYDCGIKMIIDQYFNDANLINEREFFHFIRQKYVANSLIGNFSNKSCEYMTVEQIQKKYNFALIHRKS
jgi:hypothetical protein